jgi:hypothetical protein
LIVGLGNEFADFTQDPRRLALQAGTFVRGDGRDRAWARWADRVDGIAPYIQTATVGVNPATNLTWALMAHRDPETLAWSPEPLIDPPPAEPLPISVPPWWGMRDKHAMFYTTIGRGDHASFMLLASMLCVDSVAEFRGRGRLCRSTSAPISHRSRRRPIPIRSTRLARAGGRDLCARMRHLPRRAGRGPTPTSWSARGDRDRPGLRDRGDGRIARPVLRLDRALALWRCRKRGPGAGLHRAAARRGLGHGALPAQRVGAERWPRCSRRTRVRAIGATFCRGRMTRRPWAGGPRRWRPGRMRRADPEARRRIYDTTRHGYGNGGHRYGEDLDEADRAALIEYLKTL